MVALSAKTLSLQVLLLLVLRVCHSVAFRVPSSLEDVSQQRTFRLLSSLEDASSGEQPDRHHFWWVGVLLMLVGATLDASGLMLQKIAHMDRRKIREAWYCISCKWIAGLVMWMTGQLLYWVAGGLANQSLLAAFNCWNIVVVFILSPLFLGESVALLACIGAAITCAGCVWVVLTGPRSYQAQTAKTLESSFAQGSFFGLLVPLMLSAVYLAASASSPSKSAAARLAAASAVLDCYATLFSKCASTLTVTSVLSSTNQLSRWNFYAYVTLQLVLQLSQVHVLNVALSKGEAILVIPVCESLSIVGQVVICGIFFHEFGGFGAPGFVLFTSAIAAVLLGIVVMMFAQSSAPHPQRMAMSEEASETSVYLGSSGDERDP